MEKSSTSSTSEVPPSTAKVVLGKVISFLASVKLATFTLLALFLLTWFATLEQTVNGLKPMMDKYFDWKTLFFFPEIGKPFQGDGQLEPMRVFFPMISGFWLCVIFTVNLTIGGLIRFRKSPKKIGILLSHFSIVLLMVSAGVTKFFEKRGAMQIYEGEVSGVAQDYHEQVIEISELADGKVSKIHLIDWEYLKDLRGSDPKMWGLVKEKEGGKRLFYLEDLPFDLKVNKLLENAQVNPSQFVPPTQGQRVLDDFYLKKLPRRQETELHLAAAEIEVRDKSGKALKELFLATRSNHPATIVVEGRPYLLRMRKKLWSLPFQVQLDEFRVERDPGSSRAAAYESDVTRISDDDKEEVFIKMNEPMRREGWTFFQSSWGPQEEPNPTEYYSVFEVVHNPADHWPLVSLLIAMFGLIGHFLYRLILFLNRQFASAS